MIFIKGRNKKACFFFYVIDSYVQAENNNINNHINLLNTIIFCNIYHKSKNSIFNPLKFANVKTFSVFMVGKLEQLVPHLPWSSSFGMVENVRENQGAVSLLRFLMQ